MDKDDDDSDVFHDASIEKESAVPSTKSANVSSQDTFEDASAPAATAVTENPPQAGTNPFAPELTHPYEGEPHAVLSEADIDSKPAISESHATDATTATTTDVPSAHIPPPLPPGHPTQPPTLPSRDVTTAVPPLPPRKRKPFFWLRDKLSPATSDTDAQSTNGGSHSFTSTSNFDLLLSRVEANLENVQRGRSSGKVVDGISELKERFQAIRAELEPAQQTKHLNSAIDSPSDYDGQQAIDWDFGSKLFLTIPMWPRAILLICLWRLPKAFLMTCGELCGRLFLGPSLFLLRRCTLQ